MVRSVEVDSYMAELEHPMTAQVERLRSAILDVDPVSYTHLTLPTSDLV